MKRRFFRTFLTMLITMITVFNYLPAGLVRAAIVVPEVKFTDAPRTEYSVGDRVGFNIYCPNYNGKVEYRVVLWEDSKKAYSDLWHSGNGHPTRYYSNWKPKGNDVFTLGWPIFEAGSYRITVYAKRVGVANDRTAIPGFNCDSFMESVAFTVKSKGPIVESILPIDDVMVNQGSAPVLPGTVGVVMSDKTQKQLRVIWEAVDTSRMGQFIVYGNVEGTTIRAAVKVIVNQGVINILSVTAEGSYRVNVSIGEGIDFMPNKSRFKIASTDGYNVDIKSMELSSDKKYIQLSTDFMVPGMWYTLTLDQINLGFVVPNTGTNPYTVVVKGSDRTLGIGESIMANMTASPSDAVLNYTSSNQEIATVNKYSGQIFGVTKGTATIIVSGTRNGYNTGWTTFKVDVASESQGVAAPEASPQSGDVNLGTQVYLTTTTPGAQIYYTLDGRTPSVYSIRYTGPITIESNKTIKAIAVKSGFNSSRIETFTYGVENISISTSIWLLDKSESEKNYNYNYWYDQFDVTLDRIQGEKRVLTIEDLTAKNISSKYEVDYYDVIFTETGTKTNLFKSNIWKGTFEMEEFWNGYDRCIKFVNYYDDEEDESDVELRIFNRINIFPQYIQEWFE
jgi:hypothetical protein